MYLSTEQARVIKEAVQRSKMETANFSIIGVTEPNYPTNESEVTEFIKERTRLWRETWVTGPLEDVLENLGIKESGSNHY